MITKVDATGIYPASPSENTQYAKKDILGKDDFLKILITELTHQDPLDPLKDRDMIAQMAQLSQLEQITQFTHSVDKFFSGFEKIMNTYKALQGASLVGKKVKVEGVPFMIKKDGELEAVSYKLDQKAEVIAEIYDENGKLVAKESLGEQDVGIHVFNPTTELSDGVYAVRFSALDEKGNTIPVQVYGWDRVMEVSTEGGELSLVLESGDNKPLESVIAFK